MKVCVCVAYDACAVSFIARVTERPWLADSFFTEVFNKFIDSGSSITQRIERSKIFKTAFAKYVKEVESTWVGNSIRNLRAAQHRHERKARPAGRFVLWVDAILATANFIHASRGGEEVGHDARDFLMYFDEEKYLAAALCADASHEGLRFTRYADDGDMDIADAPCECAEFVQRVQMLFVSGKVVNLPTFTRFAIENLKRAKLVFIEGRPKSIGGPGHPKQSAIDNLLGKMIVWTKLVIASVRVEFPCWDIVQCFVVFHLGKRRKNLADQDE